VTVFAGVGGGGLFEYSGSPIPVGSTRIYSNSKKVILIIIDLTYIHQRPQAIAIYWPLCAVVSNAFLSLTPEIICAVDSWRAFYLVWVGPSVLAIILVLILCPETYFLRPAVAFFRRIRTSSGRDRGSNGSCRVGGGAWGEGAAGDTREIRMADADEKVEG
jgi:hypothetical protein